MRADTALNTSLHRASVGQVMGKVRSVPVLLITGAGRRLGSSTPIPSSLENDRRLVVTGSGLGPAAEPQWLKDRRAEIEMGAAVDRLRNCLDRSLVSPFSQVRPHCSPLGRDGGWLSRLGCCGWPRRIHRCRPSAPRTRHHHSKRGRCSFTHQSSSPALAQVAVSTGIGGSTARRSASLYRLGSRSIPD
jgi:hypothetical protein